jgi:hypothetical protein
MFTDMTLYIGSEDNKWRERNGLEQHDWKKELAVGKAAFAAKCRDVRSYDFGRVKRVGLYFKKLPDVPINYVVWLNDSLNKDSKFYKLIASMDSDSEVNLRIANLLFVSNFQVTNRDQNEMYGWNMLFVNNSRVV